MSNDNKTKTIKKLPKAGDQLYKTIMCKTFAEKGKCRYGKRCTFAHGSEDLRVRKRKPTPEPVEQSESKPAFELSDFPILGGTATPPEPVEPVVEEEEISVPRMRLNPDAASFVPTMVRT
jgi:hypothetical protein